MWRRRGVYLIFDSDGSLQYVGKATATFEKRILTKFFSIAEADTASVVAFPDGCAFMAPALESFLIARLAPPGNKNGARDYVRCPTTPSI